MQQDGTKYIKIEQNVAHSIMTRGMTPSAREMRHAAKEHTPTEITPVDDRQCRKGRDKCSKTMTQHGLNTGEFRAVAVCSAPYEFQFLEEKEPHDPSVPSWERTVDQE